MASVTGLTAARMAEIEGASIVDAALSGDDLILTRHDASTVNVGSVRGPQGVAGDSDITVSRGTYVPSLLGIAVGTGGSAFNQGRWQFVGGTTSGSYGLLNLNVALRFGTTGTTFPSATAARVALPSGFELSGHQLASGTMDSLAEIEIGKAWYSTGYSSGTRRQGFVGKNSDYLQLHYWDLTTGAPTAIGATAPITWVAGSSIQLTCLAMFAMRT